MILAASILAADLGQLAEQVRAAERGGAGLVHVDVMDGRFVPNISLAPIVVSALKRVTNLPIDVHLMIESAEAHLDAFVAAGASALTVHVEAVVHLQRTLVRIREHGLAAGVALVVLGGLIGIVELVYRLSDVSGGTQLSFAGVAFDAKSTVPWAAFGLVFAAGLVALRTVARLVGTRWGAIQTDLLAKQP